MRYTFQSLSWTWCMKNSLVTPGGSSLVSPWSFFTGLVVCAVRMCTTSQSYIKMTIFVRSSAPVHATGLCSNIMNIRRWYYHILNSRLWWHRRRFELFRPAAKPFWNSMQWSHHPIYSNEKLKRSGPYFACQDGSNHLRIMVYFFSVSRYCRLDIRCLLVSLRGKGYYISRLSRDLLYPKRFMYLALSIINPNGLHSTTIR